MKKNLIGLMLMFPISLLAQNVSYTLKGKIGNLNAPAKVYMGYESASQSFADSTTIIRGQFEFNGTIKEAVKATIVLSHTGAGPWSKPAESINIYLEPGVINVTSPDSLSHAKVAGSKINSENDKLYDALSSSNKMIILLSNEYNSLPADKRKDKAFISGFMKDYMKRQKAIIGEQNEIRSDFIRKHLNSMVSLDAIKAIERYSVDYAILFPLFDSLSDDLKNTPSGKAYGAKLAKMSMLRVGSKAPAFEQNDVNNTPVKLSSFEGKYVLVDFWASWCGPCRLENPNVVKAYQKYHDKGFEILGVSLDKTKEGWLKAIRTDRLTWAHVSDLKGWKNEVARLYGVHSVPQNLLLDQSGRIIAKDLRGEALDAKLGEIFK